jgi:hypothetical protein
MKKVHKLFEIEYKVNATGYQEYIGDGSMKFSSGMAESC